MFVQKYSFFLMYTKIERKNVRHIFVSQIVLLTLQTIMRVLYFQNTISKVKC